MAIIVYSDFECPFCSQFHTTVKEVVDASNGELMWVYRNFPLKEIHPDATKKAIAAECVAKVAGEDNTGNLQIYYLDRNLSLLIYLQ